MREEILRARHNLLTSQDSARVESVIRLLEQTYQRLENEAATTAALDAVAASLVSTSRAVIPGGARGATAPPIILRSRYFYGEILVLVIKFLVLAPQ